MDGAKATPFERTRLDKQGLLEVDHLEPWVVEHPEVLGGNVRVITQQFDRWATAGGQVATERLDVLGLDSTGQLVVVELKRDGDKRVHLQALTYAALVARFTKEALGAVHAEYLNRTAEEPVTPEAALARLTDHVEGDWGEELLTRPRIVLIAERFPSQVMSTVSWLTELAPQELEIYCVELSLFVDPNDGSGLCATFQQIFPIDDMADRVLGPTVTTNAGSVSAKIAQRTRQQRSAAVIVDNSLIPNGSQLTLRLETLQKPEVVTAVNQWLLEDPARSVATWRSDRQKPVHWLGEPDVDGWSPTKLVQHIIVCATDGSAPTISGPDAWTYQGKSLYAMATEFLASSEASTT
ncbi:MULTISPECIES: hypothetical protein [unclassified Kineococcus]|uniref:hypothetical protein n=1 Tax=unclassified Kineococcus TaxID=2621656 RepID=UPI00301C7C49